jgi:CCR4-NOT transcription complex subunit 3
VQEGTDLFEEIWKKMEDATDSTKKEKFESELKHQLKRLQRWGKDPIKVSRRFLGS